MDRNLIREVQPHTKPEAIFEYAESYKPPMLAATINAVDALAAFKKEHIDVLMKGKEARPRACAGAPCRSARFQSGIRLGEHVGRQLR